MIDIGGPDIPEIVEALAAYVADSKPYLIHYDPPLDLRTIVAEVQLLPVILDMGGCMGLRQSGEVAFFVWDEPRHLQTVRDERIRNMAYFQASLKYPTLAPLVPCRPADAVVCSSCEGSGRLSKLGEQLADRIVCYCGGIGWLPGKTNESRLPGFRAGGGTSPRAASNFLFHCLQWIRSRPVR